MWRNTREAWGNMSKLLHWLMALLIAVLLVLGWCAKAWPLSPLKLELFVWHKSMGILILVLGVMRLLWRSVNFIPLISNSNPIERMAACGVHVALYGVMIIMPLSGWVITSAANIPVKLFWLIPLPFIVERNKELEIVAKQIHATCMIIFLVLITLHIGAALKHQLINKDNIIKRMWF